MTCRILPLLILLVTGLLAAAGPVSAAESYGVDPTHSSVVFRIKHMGVSYCYGRFNKLSGSFFLDPEQPSNSTIDVKVQAESVDTANTQRDQHLRNADFFDAPKFPAIQFKSSKVTRSGDGPFIVAGELTLHGVTRPITVEVEATGSGKGMLGEVRSGLESVFTIRRSEFGMDKMVGPVGDDVRLMISLEGIRQ